MHRINKNKTLLNILYSLKKLKDLSVFPTRPGPGRGRTRMVSELNVTLFSFSSVFIVLILPGHRRPPSPRLGPDGEGWTGPLIKNRERFIMFILVNAMHTD